MLKRAVPVLTRSVAGEIGVYVGRVGVVHACPQKPTVTP